MNQLEIVYKYLLVWFFVNRVFLSASMGCNTVLCRSRTYWSEYMAMNLIGEPVGIQM